ncbi:459_t:CDS:2, partial [Racocetra persica]
KAKLKTYWSMKYVTTCIEEIIETSYRKTILEKERSKKLEAKRLLELEERKKESRLMVAEIIRKESQRLLMKKMVLIKLMKQVVWMKRQDAKHRTKRDKERE